MALSQDEQCVVTSVCFGSFVTGDSQLGVPAALRTKRRVTNAPVTPKDATITVVHHAINCNTSYPTNTYCSPATYCKYIQPVDTEEQRAIDLTEARSRRSAMCFCCIGRRCRLLWRPRRNQLCGVSVVEFDLVSVVILSWLSEIEWKLRLN